MRREIAMLTEWAWIDGVLTLSDESIERFAQSLATSLQKLHSTKFGCMQSSVNSLKTDVEQTMQRLSYGGRKPQDLHPKRAAYIREKFQQTSLAA